jgi:hypothetical protein
MQPRKSILLLSVIVGVTLGKIGGPVFILIPWGIVGLTVGIFSARKRLAVLSGGLYGFAVAFTFMVCGYSGVDPVTTRILPFAILGIIGAVCGLVLALIGYLIYRNYQDRKVTK